MKTVNIPERLLEPVVGFIAEAMEIIDGEWGKKRTYEELERDGLVIEDIRAFMSKFREYRPITQAQENKRFEKEQLAIQEANKDDRDGIITVEVEE